MDQVRTPDQIRVEFTMPPRPLAQLEELSVRTGIRRSDLIRFAIMKLVDRPEVLTGGPTAAALAALQRAANGEGQG
jgi:hypothetical protein